ncbi:GPI inositol-deacylase isoform X1 [Nerophis lumbriciformis]|uniref:GPI inositol-deacylase isoform X1 n=2 Tax=Nerophis lumbriciformis TaxID=546530 RepID=UPI003BAA46BB
MNLRTVLFYVCAASFLAVGLKELLTGFEDNRCSMTYMFEYPQYLRVPLPRRVARLYPAYGLYLYGEGRYAQETRELHLFGVPLLFLPGNAGSYKQARSLGSVALRKAERMEGGLHFNVFTVDFNEELVALYGGSLLRQTHFLHESIKAILKLYKHLKTPPQSVALVGHSMGGVVARALFTLPHFNTKLVSLIITQASPHVAPVLAMDPYLLDFYSSVSQKWLKQANKLKNITILSVGGGYRDYQVRSGLTCLPSSPPEDPNKLSVVVTAVPRTWVSTDHLSIVWCKELVLATVRAIFDLIDPESRQLTEDPEKRMSVLNQHFLPHSIPMLGDREEISITVADAAQVWSEVNTLRLTYSTTKEIEVRYFLFALASRRKAYSHFYCRSSNLDKSSWVYGCTHRNASSCRNIFLHSLHAVDLSKGTELLPPYKVLRLSVSDLSSFTHLVVSASNLNGKRFMVECEWQRQKSVTLSVPVPHVLSFGWTVSDITINLTGLLHTIELQHFHQVYQAFRISVVSQCKAQKDRLPSVYRIKVPWFLEDSLTTASVPSVTEISGMLHTCSPDNVSSVHLQLHTAPNCQYKVSVRTSLPMVLGQVLRFFGPMVPMYTSVTLLLACGVQLCSLLTSRRPAATHLLLCQSFQPHKVNLPVYFIHVILSCKWAKDVWSLLGLPPMDVAPPTFPNETVNEGMTAALEWPHLLHPLLYIFGAAVAFWGSTLLTVITRLMSFILAVLHRPSVSSECGTLQLRTQLLVTLLLTVVGGTCCGALSIIAAFLLHLYRVLRLQMTERYLSHILNLVPQKHKGNAHSSKAKECNGTRALLSELALQEARDDLQLHLTLCALFTVPVMLSTPSLLHWIRNLRYSSQLDPDPCWPYFVPVILAYMLLISAKASKLSNSKLLNLTSFLPLPVSIAMVTFSPLHLYRVTYFLLVVLIPLALCCLL